MSTIFPSDRCCVHCASYVQCAMDSWRSWPCFEKRGSEECKQLLRAHKCKAASCEQFTPRKPEIDGQQELFA